MSGLCGGELGWSPRTSTHHPFVLECRTCHAEAGYGNAAEALEAQPRGCQAVTPRGEDRPHG